jgi:hypothetical protein
VVTTSRALYVIGGYDGVHTHGCPAQPDGTRFAVAARLPSGIRCAGVARSGRMVWVLGGEVNGRELDEVLRFNTHTGRVRSVVRMPHPLGHEAVTVVGDRLFVMGGRTAPEAVTRSVSWYDPQAGRWRHAGSCPTPSRMPP